MSHNARQWRVLVVGVGSVGERHIGNLLTMGQTEIALVRSRGLPFRSLDRAFPTYSDLSRAIDDWRPEVVLATGPTAHHLPIAIAAAEAGCHVFVEKPLADSLEEKGRLSLALTRTRRFLMVGYMLRFHPLLQRMKAWLNEGLLGGALYWRSSWGEYLPDWHPWEDYREGYAARRALGGGPALTFSHDIDLALWMLGPVEQGRSVCLPASPLRMDVPTGVDLLLEHSEGAVASIHLDFYQRPPQRTYELVGTRGRVMLDYYGGCLFRYAYPDDDAVTPAESKVATPAEVVRLPDGFDRNDMFMAELRYFLDCIERGESPASGFESGVAVAELALALADGGVWSRSGSEVIR